MLKKAMIAGAVSAALAANFVYAQQDSQNTSGQAVTGAQTNQVSGNTMQRNQDAPPGGVGQVFPDKSAQSGSAGASGASGASSSSATMQRNQDAPPGGVGQVFPKDQASSGSAGASGGGAGAASGGAMSSAGTGKQSGSAGSGSSSQQAGAQGQASSKAPVYLLVPVDVAANDNSMRNGCWARIYSRENYSGDMLTVVGPSALPDMDQAGLFGLNWEDRVESLEIGPKATLTVYDNQNFRDKVTTFKAGQRIADIDKRTGFFDEFASLKIDCQQG